MFYFYQLSVDHTTDNDYELSRLEAIGLNKEELKRVGRLGTQENTRCIGDYFIKSGYKEVDTIKYVAFSISRVSYYGVYTCDIWTETYSYRSLKEDPLICIILSRNMPLHFDLP